MILALDMSLQLVLIEIDVAQSAGGVPLRLVVEVLRARMPALAARCHGLGADTIAELYHRDEAVAARPVPLLRLRIGARAERRQRPPLRRREADRNARLLIVERVDDVARDPLEAVDLAPRSPP